MISMISTITAWTNEVSFLKTFPSASLILPLLVLIVTAVYYHVSLKYRYWKSRNIDGPSPLPLIGNTYVRSPRVAWHELEMLDVSKYGRAFGVYAGTTPVLVVSDPKILQDILIRDFTTFSYRHPYYHKIQKQSVIAVNGKRWKEMRAIMSPTFTSGKMKAMHHLIKHSVDNLVQHIDSELASGRADFNNKELYGDLTLGVIASCAFATDTNAHQERGNNIFLHNVAEFFNFSVMKLFLFAVLPASLKTRLQFTTVKSKPMKFLVEMSRSILEQRRQTGVSSRYVDLLQLMIDAESKSENGSKDMLTDEEIIANTIIMLVAGYDTTATLLTYATYCLALHPKVQQKLRSEIEEAVIGDGGEIKYDTVMGLKYLDAVVNETLRRYPPVPRIEREATEDYELKTLGINLKKGTKIRIPIYAIHHQEEFFPDPYKFDPDRFMPENKDKLMPYTFLPFNTGPRNCIGSRFALLEAKTTLAAILLKYDLTRSSETAVPLDMSIATALLHSKEVIIRYSARNSTRL